MVRAHSGLLCLAAAMSLFAPPVGAYAQFTHLELIDIVWNDSIRPLLLLRYPATSESGLTRAHAYAYGGCLIQDIGYYPFGKAEFSNLAHHVRTGDFVNALIRNARDVNEFAFGLGALSHYIGDSIGHAEAVNPATAETFPELEAKYGSIVTPEESPTGHLRTEFGFDVAQQARRRYAPKAYRKHIGFRVARVTLYRAFYQTYGVRTRGILGPARSALATYRWSVRKLLPAFLNAEIVLLRTRLPHESQGPSQVRYLESISRSEYAQFWATSYESPGCVSHLLAAVIRVIPKIGKLRVLSIKPPSVTTEDLFVGSMNHAIANFRALLNQLADSRLDLDLPNLDLDTGAIAVAGSSHSADETYRNLLHKLVHGGGPVNAEVRRDVLRFYDGGSAPLEVREELELLQRRL